MKGIIRQLLGAARAFYKIPFQIPYWGREEARAIARHWLRRKRSETGARRRFIRHLCGRVGVPYGLATNMGRSAIELALRAHGVGPSHEVILPTLGCLGMAEPVLAVGATPLFIDIRDDLNLCPENLRSSMTARTRAILMVHFAGKTAPIEAVREAVKERPDILLIEDACAAFGGIHKGKPLGTYGDCAVFSFGTGKNIMATAGGAVVTRSSRLYEKMKSLLREEEDEGTVLRRSIIFVMENCFRRYTLPFFVIGEVMGVRTRKSEGSRQSYRMRRMSRLDAVLAHIQLSRTDEIVSRRKRNAGTLAAKLSTIESLTAPDPGAEHTFTHFFVSLKSSSKRQAAGRTPELEAFRRHLRRKGIETEVGYVPLHLRRELSGYGRCSLPVSEEIYPRLIVLPIRPQLTDEEMGYIGSTILSYFSGDSAHAQSARVSSLQIL